MKPILLVHQETKSSWVSCQSIVANLKKAYQMAFGETAIQSVALNSQMDRFQVMELAKEIAGLAPEKIVFIDHKPHPFDLIKCLDQVCEGKLPELYFHAFGDFTLNPIEWLGVEDQLAKTKVKIFAASEKQAALLNSFVTEPEKIISYLPFPVSTEDFKWEAGARNTIRNQFEIADDDFVFVYTGRLSIQKNVLDLIATFQNLHSNFNSNCHIIFAGPMDDIGVPFLGKYVAPGGFHFHWNAQVGKLPKEAEKKFHYLGNLDQKQLHSLYCAGDAFISLSTHNDEDFGMSPAEALCCGMPAILSDWGGYSSFNSMAQDNCLLVPCSVEGKKVAPNLVIALKQMMAAAQETLNANQRQQLSEKVGDKLSIKTISNTIKEEVGNEPERFTSFNNHFGKLGSAWKLNAHAPFLDDQGNFSNFYRELYSVYL
ncbi:MAG: glycosyltransferase family 4 protein [Halobacteriovoraceae bacterium]|nr:glycosyltransferase family 4 protein [Halobacteriovoraceae bacterium]